MTYLILYALTRLQAGKDLALDCLDPQFPLLICRRFKVPSLACQRHNDELKRVLLLWKTKINNKVIHKSNLNLYPKRDCGLRIMLLEESKFWVSHCLATTIIDNLLIPLDKFCEQAAAFTVPRFWGLVFYPGTLPVSQTTNPEGDGHLSYHLSYSRSFVPRFRLLPASHLYDRKSLAVNTLKRCTLGGSTRMSAVQSDSAIQWHSTVIEAHPCTNARWNGLLLNSATFK